MTDTWQPTQTCDIVMYGIRLMTLSLTHPLTVTILACNSNGDQWVIDD